MKQPRASTRRVRPWLRRLFAGLLLAALWQHGAIGGGLRRYLLPPVLPPLLRHYGIEIHHMGRGVPSSGFAEDRGLRITVSRAYLMGLLQGSPFPAWLVPPGLIADGFEIGADWTPAKLKQAARIPVVLRLAATAGRLPQVRFRFPAGELNSVLSAEFAEDWSDTEEYWLGHYDLNQRIWFDTFTFQSLDMPRRSVADPVRFSAQATGRLRYWFKDGPVSARLTAEVRRLAVVFELKPVEHDDGIGFDYRVRIRDLKLTADRTAPWLEKRLTKAIRRSMERSLNKRRKRERMARRRLPVWLPLDVAVDLELGQADAGAQRVVDISSEKP